MNDTRLFIDENDRYSRLELIGWWDQRRLREAHILVVGAGALGNEVLKNLALIGIGRISVIDFDTIEHSNLSRSVLFRGEHAGENKATVAAKSVRELNPDVQVDAIVGNVLSDVGLGLVRAVDVVIACLDNREARLWVNRLCWKVGTPWIDGGIQEINGVAKVFRPPDGACYECAMTENDYRLIQLRYSCPLLKHEDLVQGKVPTAPTIASMIGGLQVQEALKLLHDIPSAGGVALVFNGVANQFYQTKYQFRADCLSHETYEPIVRTDLTYTASLCDVADYLRDAMQITILSLTLDRDLVIGLHCGNCGADRPERRVLSEVNILEAECAQCNQTMKPTMIHTIDRECELATQRLNGLGVPDRDILHLKTEQGPYFLELAADASVAVPATEEIDRNDT